jgi:hypothetical protein
MSIDHSGMLFACSGGKEGRMGVIHHRTAGGLYLLRHDMEPPDGDDSAT